LKEKEGPIVITKRLSERSSWHPETSEIAVLCRNRLYSKRHLWSVLNCSKRHSFTCQCRLWSKYTLTSMIRLRIA